MLLITYSCCSGTKLIAEFASLNSNQYNKVYLTNLEECYDNEIEILTEKGWKLFTELENERVMTLNSETGKTEWQLPIEEQVFDYNKEMYKIVVEDENGKESELLVSEKHKVYVGEPKELVENYTMLNSSFISCVLNISTPDCFLNLGSFDQTAQLNFSANEKNGRSLSCGENCFAFNSNSLYSTSRINLTCFSSLFNENIYLFFRQP